MVGETPKLWSKLEKYLVDKIIHDYAVTNIHTIGRKEICEIKIEPSPKPIFVHIDFSYKIEKIDKKTGEKKLVPHNTKILKCYVRKDSSKKLYEMDEFIEYWIRRIKSFETKE